MAAHYHVALGRTLTNNGTQRVTPQDPRLGAPENMADNTRERVLEAAGLTSDAKRHLMVPIIARRPPNRAAQSAHKTPITPLQQALVNKAGLYGKSKGILPPPPTGCAIWHDLCDIPASNLRSMRGAWGRFHLLLRGCMSGNVPLSDITLQSRDSARIAPQSATPQAGPRGAPQASRESILKLTLLFLASFTTATSGGVAWHRVAEA